MKLWNWQHSNSSNIYKNINVVCSLPLLFVTPPPTPPTGEREVERESEGRVWRPWGVSGDRDCARHETR